MKLRSGSSAKPVVRTVSFETLASGIKNTKPVMPVVASGTAREASGLRHQQQGLLTTLLMSKLKMQKCQLPSVLVLSSIVL
jgi:hypothetical protein